MGSIVSSGLPASHRLRSRDYASSGKKRSIAREGSGEFWCCTSTRTKMCEEARRRAKERGCGSRCKTVERRVRGAGRGREGSARPPRSSRDGEWEEMYRGRRSSRRRWQPGHLRALPALERSRKKKVSDELVWTKVGGEGADDALGGICGRDMSCGDQKRAWVVISRARTK